jgi:hypothetical protein
MADSTITGLSAASALDGTEVAPIDQAGTTKKATTLFFVALARTVVNVFAKNQSVTPITLTDATTIAVDASLSNNFKVVLGGNRTLGNPTNLTDGMVLNFKIKQDGTGSRTLAYGSKYKWASGTVPVLSTAINAIDFFSAYYDSTDDILIGNFVKGLG